MGTRRAIVFSAALVVTALGTMRALLAADDPAMNTAAVGLAPVALAVDERAGRIFVAAADTSLSMLDARTGKRMRTVFLSSASNGLPVPVAGGIAVDPAIHRAFVAAGDGTVAAVDTRSGSLTGAVLTDPQPSMIGVDADTARIFVASARNGTIMVLNAVTGSRVRRVVLPAFPRSLTLDGAHGHLLIALSDPLAGTGGMAVLDARTGSLLRTIVVGHAFAASTGAMGGAPAPTSAILAADRAGLVDGTARLIVLDTRRLAVAGTIALPRPAIGIVAIPGGSRALIALDGGLAAIVETARMRMVRTLTLVCPCASVQDGAAGAVVGVASAGATAALRVFDERDGTLSAGQQVGNSPAVLGIDRGAGRLFVVSANTDAGGAPLPAPQPPPWRSAILAALRRIVPWVTVPVATPRGSLPGTVTTLDLERLLRPGSAGAGPGTPSAGGSGMEARANAGRMGERGDSDPLVIRGRGHESVQGQGDLGERTIARIQPPAVDRGTRPVQQGEQIAGLHLDQRRHLR